MNNQSELWIIYFTSILSCYCVINWNETFVLKSLERWSKGPLKWVKGLEHFLYEKRLRAATVDPGKEKAQGGC